MSSINYTSTIHTIYGMMSARNSLIETSAASPYFAIQKNRKKAFLLPKEGKNITFFDIEYFLKANPGIEKLSLQYLLEDNYKILLNVIKNKGSKFSKSKSTLLLSKLDDSFFRLEGKTYKEIRETRNSLSKSFYYKFNEPLIEIEQNIENLIARWDKTAGQKYGWQRHSGYDKAFFKNWYEDNIKELACLTFYEKKTDLLVGYSVISKHTNGLQKNCIPYIIRKCDTRIKRNITLFIDFTMFTWVRQNLIKNDFFVNWGASGGGVLKYKKKFPIGFEKNVYFISIKRDGILL